MDRPGEKAAHGTRCLRWFCFWCSGCWLRLLQEHNARVHAFTGCCPCNLQNVVLYAGSALDRQIIREREFWYPKAKVSWQPHTV